MKKKSYLLFSIVMIVIIGAAPKGAPPCDSPMVGGHTGAPGEVGCNGCHSGLVNSGPAQVIFELGTLTYSTGQTYTGTVRILQSEMKKFGFSALALKNSDSTSTGIFNLLETVRTRTYTDGSRKYVSHTPCGADSSAANSWRFTWEAPPNYVGPITVYVGLLAADHSHSTSGDYSYKDSITLVPAEYTAVTAQELDQEVKIWQTPSRIHLEVRNNASSPGMNLIISDLHGITLHEVITYNEYYELDVSSWTKGIYLIRCQIRDKVVRKKILIEN